MSFHSIPLGEKMPEIVNTVIEIPRGVSNKYEYDEEYDVIRLDRVLHSPMFYPVDYGFIPETRAGDGDHLDVLVVNSSPVFPGCLMEIRIIGVLEMSDEAGEDNKIIAVPTKNPNHKKIQTVDDLDEHFLAEMKVFFQQYKTLENKEVNVGEYGTKEQAMQMIREAHEVYKNEQK